MWRGGFPQPTEPLNLLAIGGVRAAEDVLVITLAPVGDAGRSGIAFLSRDATDSSQTDVSLFVDAS